MRSSLVKINPLANSNMQQGHNNFTGINIRRHGPATSVKNSKKEKIGHLSGTAVPNQQTAPAGKEIIEKIGVNSRTGFIPQMRKVNQDSYCIQKELGGQVPGLWVIGVMDGHGVNGHQVSNFCK